MHNAELAAYRDKGVLGPGYGGHEPPLPSPSSHAAAAGIAPSHTTATDGTSGKPHGRSGSIPHSGASAAAAGGGSGSGSRGLFSRLGSGGISTGSLTGLLHPHHQHHHPPTQQQQHHGHSSDQYHPNQPRQPPHHHLPLSPGGIRVHGVSSAGNLPEIGGNSGIPAPSPQPPPQSNTSSANDTAIGLPSPSPSPPASQPQPQQPPPPPQQQQQQQQ